MTQTLNSPVSFPAALPSLSERIQQAFAYWMNESSIISEDGDILKFLGGYECLKTVALFVDFPDFDQESLGYFRIYFRMDAKRELVLRAKREAEVLWTEKFGELEVEKRWIQYPDGHKEWFELGPQFDRAKVEADRLWAEHRTKRNSTKNKSRFGGTTPIKPRFIEENHTPEGQRRIAERKKRNENAKLQRAAASRAAQGRSGGGSKKGGSR
jgi:hypothetical protein